MTEHSADTVELKPCPFCGNDGSGPIEDALQICEVDMEGQWKAPMAYSVQCDKCTATMGYSETEDEAVVSWNTRSAMPQQEVTVKDADGVAKFQRLLRDTLDAASDANIKVRVKADYRAALSGQDVEGET